MPSRNSLPASLPASLKAPTRSCGQTRSAGELPTPAKPPLHSVLVLGKLAATEEPLALVADDGSLAFSRGPALLEFVVRRAGANKALYFVTWTLRDAILWKTPKAGTPDTRDALEKLRHYADLYEIAATDEQITDEQIMLKVLQRRAAILDDMAKPAPRRSLGVSQIDATYFVGRLLEAVHRLLPMVSGSLQFSSETDHAFREELAVWAVKQGIAGDPRDPDFAESIARQIIYRLLGKVLFYQSLRRSARQLPNLDLRGVDTSRVLPTLRTAFLGCAGNRLLRCLCRRPAGSNSMAGGRLRRTSLAHPRFSYRDFLQRPPGRNRHGFRATHSTRKAPWVSVNISCRESLRPDFLRFLRSVSGCYCY